METKFKFKLGDIVFVEWRHMTKCRIIERFYEYNDRISSVGIPIENRSYKVEPLKGYDPQDTWPPKFAEDRLFGTETEAANQVLEDSGFSLRF